MAPVQKLTRPKIERMVGLSLDDADSLPYASARRIARTMRPGPRTVFLGDSITERSNPDGYRWADNSWVPWACLLSGGAIQPIYNAGVGGERLDQFLTRIDADVIAHHPDMCVVLGGTNDISQGHAVTTALGRLQAIIDHLVIAGIRPILCTIPPNNTATYRDNRAKFNAGVTMMAARQGYDLVDFYSALIDTSNAAYRSGLSVDGTHENVAGARLMGEVAASVFRAILSPTRPPLASWQTDGMNLATNGLFLAVSGGFPTSWTRSSGALAGSTVASDADALGNWYRLVQDGSSNFLTQNINASAGWAVGDVLQFSGLVDILAVSPSAPTTASLTIRLQFNPGGTMIEPVRGTSGGLAVLDGGYFFEEKAVPAGTTSMTMTIIPSALGTEVRIAQISVINITQLGLA